MESNNKTGTMRAAGIPLIRPLKRRSDGEIVYASSGIPYKNGDEQQRLKHELVVITRNSLPGNFGRQPPRPRALLCSTCSHWDGCPGVRHCTRRTSGEKLPGFEPVGV